jgi:hypothetical protein
LSDVPVSQANAKTATILASLTSPQNGEVLVSPTPYGNGQLIVKNGTSQDAIVKLINPDIDQIVASFYIRAKQTATLKNVPDGSYRIIFTTGKNYNSGTSLFTRNVSYSKFDKIATFSTRVRQEGNSQYTQFSIMQITLHPVVGGNAKTQNIPQREFQKYR